MIHHAVGGAFGKGGEQPAPRAPVIAKDTLRSNAVVEIVEAICEGEIAGFATPDPLHSIYLDDTPLKTGDTLNFSGVSVDYRLGTQHQTYMPGSIDATSAVVPVGADVTFGNPIIRTINDSTVDAVRVTIKFSSLMTQDVMTGDRYGATVDVDIHVRLDGGPWLPADLQGRGTVKGKTESPYERSFIVNLKAFGLANVYDIRVTRVTQDPGPNTFSAFRWEGYSRLNYAKLRYPHTAVVRATFDAKHFSSIPRRGFLLKGLKVKVPPPSVYDPVQRTYTGADWDGSFVVAWTRCPAWIFYDLVTNPRYGLGELINPVYQDKWALFQIAKRCDELIADGFGGQEPRYSLDLYIQQDNDAKQVVMDIASAFDAMAYWSGGSVYTTQDSPKAATALFVPGNVVGGRFAYAGASRQVRYTVALVQWNDPSDNYRIATEYVEDRDGIERYGYREKQIAAIGCTSRGQAHRAGKRILLTSRLETDTVSFSVGLDGISVKPGDIVRVADPLRADQHRLGGRVSMGSTTRFIELDAAVTLQAGVSYRLAVIASDGTVIEAPVVNPAGSNQTIECSPMLSSAPEPDTAWILYDVSQVDKQYRVLSVAENVDKSSGFYTITAVQYAPEKYAALDDIGELPPIPTNPFVTNGVVPPSGLIVTEGVYSALEGMRRYIDLSWSSSTDRFLRGYRLVYRRDGVELFDDEVDGQTFRIMNPERGDWEFTLSAVTVLGKYSTSITVQYSLGEMYLVESVSITDLVLVGGGTTFSGRSPEFDWDTDAVAVLGFSDTYGAGQGGQSPWFRDYQVDIFNGATLLRTDFVTESRYVYSYEKNLEDGGPRRVVTIRVRARDSFGRYSQSAQLTVSNPAPNPILASNVSVTYGVKSAVITYKRPSDNDWLGVIVFMSQTSGFTPSRAANQVFIGSDTSITVPNLVNGQTYYFRIAAYDAFYDIAGTGTDYALTPEEFSVTVISESMPSPQEIKDGLQSALNSAIDPLVFNADVFAINLNGVDKTPFVIGVHQGQPAILMDSDVVVTGSLSADNLLGGRIAATEDITIGTGNALIKGDGSIITYNGPDTVSNRDFALLTGGTLTFQRFRGGQYREYKSLKRVEYGSAQSGDTVTLPGYWDAQPRIVVTPASLRSYDYGVSASQTWIVRSENLAETAPGSGVWEFDAIAELVYANNAGVQTVASSSGNLGVNSWTSGESVLPNGTVSVTPTVKFTSVRGNGTSTYGYYYRTVTWTVQGWNGSVWVDLATKTRNLSMAEHGQQITDTQAVNITAGITKIQVRFVAGDTNGSTYYLGNNQENVYDYSTSSVMTNGASTFAHVNAFWPNSRTANSILTGQSYTAPAGWEIYKVNYSCELNIQGYDNSTNETGGYILGYLDAKTAGTYQQIFSKSGWAYGAIGFHHPSQNQYVTISSGDVATSVYDPQFFRARIFAAEAEATTTIRNHSATVYIRKMQVTNASPQNSFVLQDYAWSIAGASYIAQGSLNWIAIGD